MSKIKSVLNVIITVALCYYIGHFIFVLWNHCKHPEIYAMQSAPWYTSLWIYGIAVLVIMAICSVIKFFLNYIEKNRKKKP